MEEQMRDNVIAALRTVYDPEIPVNIYDLGLVYGIDLKPEGRVDIRMTLTAPACPVAGEMPGVVEERVMQVPDVSEVRVDEGPTLHRHRRAAMGRASPIRKRTSHITVVVDKRSN